jgi:ribonuclease P protein component
MTQARSLRFRRAQHVLSGAHFARAYRRGSRARGDVLMVVAVPNGGDTTRLGLSVGKKIWKSAVRRNRIRRVFREAFRTAQHELPKGYDLVLIPAQPRLEPQLEPTRRELVRLARKAAARCEAKRGGPGRSRD